MPRLPHNVLQAPTGMDATSDPVAVASGKCRYLVNYLLDTPGALRGQVNLLDAMPAASANQIDGIGWYYAAQVMNGTVRTTTDVLMGYGRGALFYLIPNTLVYPPTFGPSNIISDERIGRSNLQTYPWYSTKKARTATFEQEMIWVQDGGTIPFRYSGSHMYTLGVAPLQAGLVSVADAAVAGVLNGTYQYAASRFDEQGRESSLSTAASITVNNSKVTVIVDANDDTRSLACDPQVRGCYIYRTTSGGSIFYRLGTVNRQPPFGFGRFLAPLSPQPDNVTDDALVLNALGPNPGQYDVPNAASLVAIFKNHVILNDLTQAGTVQISNLSSATQFSSLPILATDGVRLKVSSDQGDPVTAFIPFGSVLGIAKRRGLYILYGNDFSDFAIYPVAERGCIAPDSAVRCNQFVIWLAEDGVYAASSDAVAPEKISKDIEVFIRVLRQTPAGLAQLEASVAWFASNRYHLAVGPTIYVYDLDTLGWAAILFGTGSLSLGIPGVSPITIVQPLAGSGSTATTGIGGGASSPMGGGSGSGSTGSGSNGNTPAPVVGPTD